MQMGDQNAINVLKRQSLPDQPFLRALTCTGSYVKSFTLGGLRGSKVYRSQTAIDGHQYGARPCWKHHEWWWVLPTTYLANELESHLEIKLGYNLELNSFSQLRA